MTAAMETTTRSSSTTAAMETTSSSSTSPIETTSISSSTTPIATTTSSLFTDCWDLRNRGGYTDNAIYDIYLPPNNSHVRVSCDMTTDTGGWTILQRRYDGSVSFTRSFQEYQDGFGNLATEYWVGLDWMYLMTTQATVQLRVDLCKFNGETGYALYDGFRIAGSTWTYEIRVGTWAGGSLPNSLRWSNGKVFQTTGGYNEIVQGGWWARASQTVYLNGGRYNGGARQGIVWDDFGEPPYMASLRSSEMKIRPVNVPRDSTHAYRCRR